MIIVQLTNGLGNQLFQYAAARRLALRHSTTLKLDLSWFHQGNGRRYGLNHFNIAAGSANAKDLKAFGLSKPEGLLDTLRRSFSRCQHYKEAEAGFDPAVMDLPDQAVLTGYFQSQRYFDDAADTIRQELQFKHPLPPGAGEALARIRSCHPSVGLHVRRGDYIDLPEFGALPLSYYQTAVSRLTSLVGIPLKVFVFSDDPEWCRSHLTVMGATEVVAGDLSRPHDDLRLLSLCDHNIIANSSFSWWAAWLNPNPHKIVIAPRTWFASWLPDGGRDIVPPAWIRV